MTDDPQWGPRPAAPRWRVLAPLRSKLTGDAAVYLGATMINAAVPFLLLPFLTRWLGPADFGVVAIFVALVNVLGVVVGLGTHGLISVVYFKRGPETMPPQVGAAVAVAAMTSTILLLGVLAFRSLLARWVGIDEAWLWAVVAASASQFILFVAFAVAQTRRQPLHYAALQISFGMALALLTIMFVAALDMGWAGRVLAQALTAGVLAAAGLVWLTRSGGIEWRPSRWPVRAALAFGLPLVPHGLAAAAMASVDRLALGGSVGPSAVGHYFIAAQLASVLVVLATALNQAWLPWLYERLARDDEGARRQVVKATYLVFVLLLGGAATLAVAAPWLVPFVAGPGFEPGVGLLRLLAPAAAFNAMYFFVVAFLFYQQRTALISAVTTSIVIVNAILSFGLAPRLGAVGVAGASLFSAFLYWLSVWILAARSHPLPWLAALGTPRNVTAQVAGVDKETETVRGQERPPPTAGRDL